MDAEERLKAERSDCVLSPRGLLGRYILNSGNMEDGALNIFLCKRAGIQFDADFDEVPLDERHVVVGDAKRPAVRKGDAERPEWDFIHALAQLRCRYGAGRLSLSTLHFKRHFFL
jgi:hypothetical protein